MTGGEIGTIATAVAAVLGLLAALIRHWMNIERERTREEDAKQQKEIDTLFQKFDLMKKEMHDEFVRMSHYQEMNHYVTAMMDNFGNKMDGIAKDLNQLIGQVRE